MLKIVNQLILNPSKLFLIDGLGAFLTAGSLLAILTTFNEYFGMPQKALVVLSIIAIFFCVFSTACFAFAPKNWRALLKAISIANLLYCCLTLGLVIGYYPQLSIYDFAYFSLEIIVVCVLVFIERKAILLNP